VIEVITGIAGLIVGVILAWIVAKSKSSSALTEARTEAKIASESLAEARSDFEKYRAQLDIEKEEKTRAQVLLQEERKNLEEQKKMLEDAKKALTDTFKALSGEALKSNNQAFLESAKKSLEAVLETAKGDLKTRQESIKGLVKPVQDSLKRYEEQITRLEKERQNAYGGLKEQVSELAKAEKALRKETSTLATALRNPQARGRWGEITLRRVVELAGMSDYCDFTEQQSVDSQDNQLRPDMVVRLPSNRQIVIDSKASFDAYLEAMSCEDAEQRKRHLTRHAQQVRERVKRLSEKKYWEQFDNVPEFVVLFLPGESFFSAAVECDQSLIADAFERKVVIATATTLFSVLRAVEYGWRQQKMAESAREISEQGRELYKRLASALEHLARMGSSLDKSMKSYNDFIGSLERRVLPTARRLEGLGAAGGAKLPEITEITRVSRTPQIPELGDPGEQAG